MNIYERMAGVAHKLLRPASDEPGTFGQGTIELVAYEPGAPTVNPWDAPSAPTRVVTPLKAAARGPSPQLVGSEIAPGVQLKVTDIIAIVAPWGGDYDATTQTVEVGGVPVTVLRVDKIPAAGTTSAVRLYLRS